MRSRVIEKIKTVSFGEMITIWRNTRVFRDENGIIRFRSLSPNRDKVLMDVLFLSVKQSFIKTATELGYATNLTDDVHPIGFRLLNVDLSTFAEIKKIGKAINEVHIHNMVFDYTSTYDVKFFVNATWDISKWRLNLNVTANRPIL
jgi:hypothetical protein